MGIDPSEARYRERGERPDFSDLPLFPVTDRPRFEPPPRPPDVLPWKGAPVDAFAGPSKTGPPPTELPPAPIVHPAGVIPPEVEQAVTQQIEAKNTAALIAATLGASDAVPHGPWIGYHPDVGPAGPKQVGLSVPHGPVFSGVPEAVANPVGGPAPGWLGRLLRRLFG